MDFGLSIVLLPIAASVLAVWIVYKLACKRDGRVPADDLGFWWLMFLSLYTSLPSIVWFLKGGIYGPFSPRLLRLDPTVDDVFYLQSIAACYAIFFAIFYWIIRRRANTPAAYSVAWISNSKMLISAIIVGIAFVTGLFMSVEADPSAGYGDRYRVIASLPLAVKQFLKIIGGLGTVSLLVLLISILQRWPRYKFYLILYIIATLVAFNPSGSRGETAMMLFALAVGWHTLVKPIGARKWFIGGVVGLIIFLAVGVFRGFTASPGDLLAVEISILGLGEFDQLWSNAIELLHASQEGNLAIPFSVQYSEIWAAIPSQFLPVEKGSLSIWFLDVFYPTYKAEGGGWAFGALSQAVVGGGLAEAAVRGALLGCVVGLLFRWYRTSTSSWWVFPTYLYLIVTGFNSVRDTTFRPLSDVIQIVLPSLIIIAIAGSLLTKGSRRQSDSAPLHVDGLIPEGNR